MNRASIVLVLITLGVAFLGGWAGARFGAHEARTNMRLDVVLHQELGLSGEQRRQMDAMEGRFAVQRHTLESEMRAANGELAHAIVTDRRMSPAAERAIGRFHEAMRQLQELTTAHVLEMRGLLTPQQAVRFDQTVIKVLGSDEL